jgi:hypothetical protein
MNENNLGQVYDSNKEVEVVTTANTSKLASPISTPSYTYSRGYYTLLFNLSSKMVRFNDLVRKMYVAKYGSKSLVKSEEAIACFSYNLIKAVKLGQYEVSFSSDRNVYNHVILNGEKIHTGVGYTATMQLVDLFEDEGLLLVEKGYKFSKLKKSGFIQLTQRLVDMVEDNVDTEVLVMKQSKDVLILRNDKGLPLEFVANKYTRSIIKVLTKYNKFMSGHVVTLDGETLDTGLCRIFNKNFKQGGRLYTSGNSYQGVYAYRRKDILIDGAPTAEVDIKGSHISMLHTLSNSYFLEGWDHYSVEMDGVAEYDTDTLSYILCYCNEKYNPFRNLVKLALLIMVNADDQVTAEYALMEKIKAELSKTKTDLEKMDEGSLENLMVCGLKNVNITELFKKIKKKHLGIEHHFFTGVGNELQKLEGDIFMIVVDMCIDEGYPVLVIHDSCRAKEEHIQEIGGFIERAWSEVVGDTRNLQLEYEVNKVGNKEKKGS